MKDRRHHNTDGRRRIRRGKLKTQVKHMARRLGIPDTPPLPIGTPTPWGPIQAVGITGGERYYLMVEADGGVAMMPACCVEPMVREEP